MNPEWVLNVKRMCEEQGAAFFFKQWGGWSVDGKKGSKKHNGRILDGRTGTQHPAGRGSHNGMQERQSVVLMSEFES